MDLIAQLLLESRTCAYIDWLDDNFIRLIIIIHNKDALLVLLSAKENQQTIKPIIFLGVRKLFPLVG